MGNTPGIWPMGSIPARSVPDHQAKSYGHEHTFDTDTKNRELLLNILMELCEKVSRRMRKAGKKGRTITLKIRFSDFRTCTRRSTLDTVTNFSEIIYAVAAKNLKSYDVEKNRFD